MDRMTRGDPVPGQDGGEAAAQEPNQCNCGKKNQDAFGEFNLVPVTFHDCTTC